MKAIRLFLCVLFLGVFVSAFNSILFAGTTGKIAGKVTDSATGEPLAGVNVFLEGTALGAATDADGLYFIINIPPGFYNLKSSFIGFAEYTTTDVQVQTDLTARIDIAMQSEILTTEAVVVVAEKPVVQKDVAATSKVMTSREVQALPVTNIGQTIGLQAGVTSGFGIRGSGSEEVLFLVDGIRMRDSRTNSPVTNIPMSALQEITIQSGGSGAEYSDFRSGVVNVVSREGDVNKYSGVINFKIRPPMPKYFGISPYDPDSYWMRPYLDPDVCWTGTENGVWDEYTKRQYARFDGWNKTAEDKIKDDDPTNDLTPEAARRLFMFQHRKQGDIKDPDYDIDGGFGGPVPFISKELGNLRFFASFKRNVNQYVMELGTKGVSAQSYMLRLTSDISEVMKLSFTSFYNEEYGTSASTSGFTGMFTTPSGVASIVNQIGFTAPWRIYTDIYFSRAATFSRMFSVNLKHVLSPKAFYEVRYSANGKTYITGPMPERDFTKQYEIWPGYYVDEAPTGYARPPIFSVEGRLALGGAVSVGRDTSTVWNHALEFDLTSQISNAHQIKAGFKFIYDQINLSFGQRNYFLPEGNIWTKSEENPYRLNMYFQDKIEYEGFIANLGLIMDYTNPNGKWYDVNIYERDFFSSVFSPEDEKKFKSAMIDPQLTLSPRLMVSHPITENSKLFFNYGHYRQIPNSEGLYRMQRKITDQVETIGDPTRPLEKTISYELGYDQSLFDQFLVRLSAYYKDISDQDLFVRYLDKKGTVNYRRISNHGYEDIRGFEFDIMKRMGDWITGDFNYEYRVGTSGYFGYLEYYENPIEQKKYIQENPYQEKPRPQPRIKSYIDLFTPMQFGPEFAGQKILADWHFNFIFNWLAGPYGTWNPSGKTGIQYNIQWTDYYNLDLRIQKVFPFKNFDLKFYVDLYNVLNFKYFSRNSFVDIYDFNYYMSSLHLPGSIGDPLNYGNIPGDDQPGEVRKTGVAYQPMEFMNNRNEETDPNGRAIYYESATKKYLEYQNDQWVEVDKKRLNKIMDDKAYIDMPNQSYFTFLDPRSIFFGFTFTFHL